MNAQLWDLQEADNTLARLRREMAHVDDGTSARASRDTLQLALDEVQTKLSALNDDVRAREDELKTTESKIAHQKSRVMAATSAHEISALERDIAALNTHRGGIDEALLLLMDEVSEIEQRASQLAARLDTARAQTEEIETVFARESSRLSAEIATANNAREHIAAALSADEKEKYDEVAARHHGVAVAVNEGGNCSACGNTLTPYNLKEARSQTWPTCENCGRLLFVK